MYTTLLSPTDLHALLGKAVILDCRSDLMKHEAGRAAYIESHIPGAVYADLNGDLSSPITSVTGRHPLPSAEKLAETLGKWGISSGTQVVAYDADSGMYASRAWWLLRWL